MQEFRSAVVDLVEQLIAPISARGGGNFASEVADRIPAQVFCWMMGAPVSRADEIFTLSNTLQGYFNGDPGSLEALASSAQAMNSFADDMIALKRATPADDLMSILVSASDQGIIEPEDLRAITQELLTASSDTTALSACRVIAQLASRPSDWARLRSDTDSRSNRGVSSLRYHPRRRHTLQQGTHGHPGRRYPGRDDRLARPTGSQLRSGVYNEPKKFDITRQHARPQLNFGRGGHFCIGAALARMELEALVSVLT